MNAMPVWKASLIFATIIILTKEALSWITGMKDIRNELREIRKALEKK